MNVTRYEPFGDLFDDLFRGFLVRPVYGEQGQQAQAGAPMRLRVDVKEHDGAYTVVADVPGVKKEDIQVTVDGDVLTIQAESRGESEKKEGERVVFSGGLGPLAFRGVTGHLVLTIEPKDKGSHVKLTYAIGGHDPKDFEDMSKGVDGVLDEAFKRYTSFAVTGKP